MTNPAIVVVAYNRPVSLQRLLDSIAAAQYSGSDIPLIISIDRSEDNKTQDVANNFNWEYGDKSIILADEHLGLKNHVLKCGQLTKEHENIIVLEDDLMVSPDFYSYAQEAISFYKDSSSIASISLYNYQITESSFQPFYPIEDGSDVYFMRFTSSWGQIWSQRNWARFKEWLMANQSGKPELLPKYIQDWGGNSWKKLFINYMLDQDLYTVFPRVSYSTNFEDPGTHASTKGLFQVPIGRRSDTSFVAIEDSKSRYDEYFELESSILKEIVPDLKNFDFEVDLSAAKRLGDIEVPYVLTNKPCKNSEHSFSDELTPSVLNVINGLKGDSIHLCKKENIQDLTYEASQKFDLQVVIPLAQYDHARLEKTLLSIDRQSYNCDCLLVVKAEDLVAIEKLRKKFYVNLRMINAEENDVHALVEAGFKSAKSDVVTWITPGNQFEADAFEYAEKTLSKFGHINYLNSSANPKNLAPFRWTISNAIRLRKSKKAINSEGWFFRTEHLLNLMADDEMGQYDLALKILKRDFVFTSSKMFMKTTEKTRPLKSEELKVEVDGVHRSLLRKVIGSTFKWFYQKNITLFRFVYVESEGINPVVRYDAKHDSFYLARY